MKRVSKSQAYLLYRMQITTEAVLTVSELGEVLKQHTYHPDKVREGQQLLDKVQKLQAQQDSAQRNAQKAQHTLRQARETMQALYIEHLEIARFAYRRDEDMQRKLMLTGSRHRKYTEWLEQVKVFYQNVEVKIMAKYDLRAAEITEARQLIDQLLELEVLRNNARRQAQQSSQSKQEAFIELREWYCRFMRVAKIACEHDPQLMESLGVVVPS